MEIAVLVNPDGNAAALQQGGCLQIYKKSCPTWELSRSMSFTLSKAQGLTEIRDYIQMVLDFLGDCRVLAAGSISGLLYFELEKAGCTTWEIEGDPADFLDIMAQAESKDPEINSAPPASTVLSPPEPREVSPGCYSISLQEIQNCSGKITSKQVLVPLLKKMDFNRLDIICSHVPPWLEQQILTGQLKGHIDITSTREMKVTISGK